MFPARLLLFSKGIPPPRDVPSIKHQRRTPLFYAVSRPIERRFATLQNSRRAFRLSPPLLCMLSPFLFFYDHPRSRIHTRFSRKSILLACFSFRREKASEGKENVNYEECQRVEGRGNFLHLWNFLFVTTLQRLQTRAEARVDFDSATPLENLSIPTVLENAVSDPRAWISRRLVKL